MSARRKYERIQEMQIVDKACVIIVGISYLATEFDGWRKVYLILVACAFLVIYLSPMKYFCGDVSLRITDKAIERRWMFFKTCTVSRENLNVFYRDIYGKSFLVFSNSYLSHLSNFGIHCAAFKRKAIIFPDDTFIRVDFPEWF